MNTKKTALITGGSSGIGYTISKRFAKAGYNLLWVSLLPQELQTAKTQLQQQYNCTVETLEKDLSRPNAAKEVFEWIKQNNKKVDVLINNAGIGTFGFVNEIDIEKEINLINLNVLAVYKLTRLFLSEMEQRNEGTIINICSNSSFQPLPKFSTYSASKSFINQFTRSISEELKIKKSKVKMICVCPAAIKDTNFKKTCNMERVKTFNGMVCTTAEEVADDVWNGFINGKDFIVSGKKMRLLYSMSNFVPYKMKQFLVRQEIKESN